MYDLSGLRQGETARVQEDWKRLRRELQVTSDEAYLKHEGKPLVAVWGIGFGDGRGYTLKECRELVSFLKDDGCAVMLGVPTGWREGVRDAIKDPGLQSLIKSVDVPMSLSRRCGSIVKTDPILEQNRPVGFRPLPGPVSGRNLWAPILNQWLGL